LIYEPNVCLILQGAKRTIIGDKVLEYGQGACLAITAELSALGQIAKASVQEPFVALVLSIDLDCLIEVMHKSPNIHSFDSYSYGLETASDVLIDAWGRLLSLMDRPEEIPVLATLFEQELMFRLLKSPVGPFLRQLGSMNSDLTRIRKAIGYIRDHHADKIEIADMADLAGMSLTTFHRRFKKVTGVSPLQYQKQIRLHEAKRYLVACEGSAASAAFQVGYESTSQFSREYRRLFGMPPAQDAAAARELAKVSPQIG